MTGFESPLHIALVLVVVLMVFGAKRLPEMGKGLGEGMRGFKQALGGEEAPQPAQISLAQVQPPAAPVVPAASVAPVAPVASAVPVEQRSAPVA